MFTKRAITKTNIDATVLTDYIELWRKGETGGEGGGRWEKGEEKEEGEIRRREGEREEGEIE